MGFIPGMQGWIYIHKTINIHEYEENKTHIITLIDAAKISYKTQCPFVIFKNAQ